MLFEGNCKPFANDLKAIYEKKVYYFESNKPLFELWYHQESNRGHKDFQSFALPTELWHHRYLQSIFVAFVLLSQLRCKGSTFILFLQVFLKKNVSIHIL